jgi:hypothetical protein
LRYAQTPQERERLLAKNSLEFNACINKASEDLE